MGRGFETHGFGGNIGYLRAYNQALLAKSLWQFIMNLMLFGVKLL